MSRITGAGVTSAPAAEQDLATSSYDDVTDPDARANLISAENAYRRDLSGSRTTGQALGDTAIDVGSGLMGGLGGVVSLGAGLLNNEAGVAVARGVREGTNWLAGNQSEDLQARRRAFESRNELATRDNALLESREAPNDNSDGLIAGGRRILRDARDVGLSALSDPTVASSVIANAVGSFGSAGAVGKGLQVLGRAAPILARNAGTLGIGLTEAAGAHQQTAAEISDMTESQLQANSPAYRALRDSGMGHTEARNAIANNTGLAAAAITAPAALAAGRLVERFQMNPMRVPNLMTGLGNIGKEMVEEALQGGAGQISQNLATQMIADQSRSLAQGVGEQVSLGALGGFGAAGAMQAPGIAREGLASGARAVGRAAVRRVDALLASNENSSPVSDAATREATNQVVTQLQAPETIPEIRQAIEQAPNATPASVEKGNTLVDRLQGALLYNHQELVDTGAPASVVSLGDGSTDKLDLIERLHGMLEGGAAQGNQVSQEDRLFAAQLMVGVQDEIAQLSFTNPADLQLEKGTPGKEMVDRFLGLVTQTRSSPGFQRAVQLGEQMLTQAQEKGELTQDITPENLDTAEGQRQAQVAAAAAIVDPEHANIKTVVQMLAHSVTPSDGAAPRLKITPAQRNSLLAVKALLEGNQRAVDRHDALGHSKPLDRVSKGILTDEKTHSGAPVSALSQAKAVAAAMRAGDVPQAKRELRMLQLLVKHMKNKVGAFNQHFEQGGGRNVPYEALSLFRKGVQENNWYTNASGHAVHPTNANSIEMAQRTAIEAQRLVDIYNGLREGFPDLGGAPALDVKLNPLLEGKPATVAAEFQSGKRVRPLQGSAPAAKPAESSAAPTVPPQGVPPEPTGNAADPDLEARLDKLKVEKENLYKLADRRGGFSKLKPDEKKLFDALRDILQDPGNQQEADALIAGVEYVASNGRLDIVETVLAHMEDSAKTASKAQMESGDAVLVKAAKDIRANYQEMASRIQAIVKATNKAEPTEEEDDAAETKAEPTTIDEAFPNLLGSAEGTTVVNQLKRAFKLPKEKLSRLMGAKSPLTLLRGALTSPEALAEFLAGKGNRRTITPDMASAYQDHLALAPKILATMQSNLDAFFQTEKRFKGDVANLEKDARFTSFPNMKLLNITEIVDGKLVLNQELAESAVLAGLQWLLTGQQMGGRILDEEDLKDIVGLPEDQMTGLGDVLNHLNSTLSLSEGTGALRDKIVSFWGLRGDRTVDDALVRGIPEAVAKEVIRAMVEHDLLVPSVVTVAKTTDQDTAELVAAVIEEGSDPKEMKLLGDDEAKAVAQWELLQAHRKAHKSAGVTSYTRLTLPDLRAQDESQADSAMTQDLSLIERVVLTQPKDVNYIGQLGEVPPLAPTQMNNPMVDNTKDDLAQMKEHAKVEFKVNEPLVDLFTAMDEMGAVELLAFGDLEGKSLNANHQQSMKGKNLSIQSAFIQMRTYVEEAKAAAASLGEETKLSDIAFHFAFNVSKVGRLQMLGRYTPQSSKLMRELLVATWANLDLSGANLKHTRAFQLAMGQALGVKVHELPYAVASEKADERIDALRPVINLLGSYLDSRKLPMNAVSVIKETFADAKIELSPIAIHALMEFARMERAEDLTNFRTGLSLEADGVTNGVINAINLMSVGEFTEQQVLNMAKGGRLMNADGPQTMNEQRAGRPGEFQGDGADMYRVGTDGFTSFMKMLRSGLEQDASGSDKRVSFKAQQVLGLLGALEDLTEIMFPEGYVTFDEEKGELVFGRGVMKNPMTISIYGSGNAGIAQKLVGMIAETLYERMSNVAGRERAGLNSALRFATFANLSQDDDAAAATFDRFVTAFNTLTTRTVHVSKDGSMYTKEQEKPGRLVLDANLDPTKFTLSPRQLANLKQNMLVLFVGPMGQAIQQALGKSVFDAGQLIIKSTQAMATFAEAAYDQAVEYRLDQLKESDPTRTEDSYLSAKEQEELHKDVLRLAPLITTEHQAFYPSGKIKTDDDKRQFSTDLLGRQSTPAFHYGPGPVGVAAMPGLNIGFGDGRAIQAALTTGKFGRSLAIFDGVHGPLDTIDEDSQALNQAVHTSWQGNPLAALQRAYASFLEASVEESISDKMRVTLSRIFRGTLEPKDLILDEASIRQRMANLGQTLIESAASVEARHKAMDTVQQSVDQMAAAGAPFQLVGERLVGDHATIAAALEVKRLALEPKPTPAATTEPTPATKKKAALGRIDKASGARVIAGLALTKAMQGIGPEILDLIRRSRSISGYTVVHGTLEQLHAYSQANGYELPEFGTNTRGLTSPSESIIYILNRGNPDAEVETVIHEVIHAATFEKVLEISQQLQDGTTPATEAGKAVLRLRELMSQFLNLDPKEMTAAAQRPYQDAVDAIRGHLQTSQDVPTRTALALNEFMAWTLSNRSLARQLNQTTANPFVKLTKEALAWIKRVVFGRVEVSEPGQHMFSHIQFNTAVIVRSNPTLQQNRARLTLAHTSSGVADSRLTEIKEAFDRVVGTHLDANPTNKPANEGIVQKAITVAHDHAQSAMDNGFQHMSQQARSTFVSIVTALATQATIDGPALAVAQALYTHVLTNHTFRDLMVDPKSTDPNQEAKAEAQWDLVMGQGRGLTTDDRFGRSSRLPVFLALATVDDGFRAALSKMGLPKGTKNKERGLDATLENQASELLLKLSARLSGTSKSRNVQAAVDALSKQIQKTSLEELSLLDHVMTPAGSLVDKTNEKVTTGLQGLAAKASRAAEKAERANSTRWTKAVTAFAHTTEALVNENRADKVGVGILQLMNDVQGWTPVRELIGDLVGRVSSNAGVYDLIKKVRSMVSQTRQRYREEVPSTIAKSFSRKLTNLEWSDLFHGLGKTDLAALVGKMPMSEVLKLFGKGKELGQAIGQLERELAPQAGKDWTQMNEKAKQLAHHMNTGVTGTFLLRNASAVSQLMGLASGRRPAASKNPAFVEGMDRLISLYAVQGLDQSVRDSVSSLAQGQAKGMEFTLAYLVGQRKDEMAKATGRAEVNHYKGSIPSLQKPGSSLIVAPVTQHAELLAKSYVKVADYAGSDLDYTGPNAVPRAYYMASVSGRSPFNQGILQNVVQTASGVEIETGFTEGTLVAGRVLSKKGVFRITKDLFAYGESSPNNENMMPIFNEAGRVVAYEKAVDPKIAAKVERDTHLARMIGVWRGRQVEEGFATEQNHISINQIHEQWVEDMKTPATSRKHYINLLDPYEVGKDPVLADAVALLSKDTKDYAVGKFGEEAFYVRRDMLNDVLGYRNASIGDAWTGVTRWEPKTQDAVRKLTMSVMGNNAYRWLVNAERGVQGVVKDLKVLVVVKSVVVPAMNFASNMHHLLMTGVPVMDIVRGMPRKLVEVQSYTTNRAREVELEANLRVAELTPGSTAANEIRAEMRSIADANRRLSIWPLIEAGEFTAISDAGISRDEILLTSGKLSEYIEKKVSELPGPFETLARYGMITRDTALFQGLQKAVDYGDFLAKAMLYDHLTKKKGESQELA
ncbi:hypothetical protein, partial [Roseococcus sp.]|uniref:hypothetical protein n=1 Tax=Roseococcus sp. TaxID=2109646 RepID=UPI003BAB991F